MATKDPVKLRAARHRWEQSGKGRASRRLYASSAAGKARTRRYRQSAKGKAWKKSQNARRAWLDGKRAVLLPTAEAADAVKALTSDFRARQGAAYRQFKADTL